MKVQIKSPCPVSWRSSDRCGTSRFCHVCTQRVHHLSNMTEPEAQRVLARRVAGEKVCVSFIGDRDGNVLFMRATAAAAAVGGLLAAQVAFADGAVPTLAPATPAQPVLADTPAGSVPDPLTDVSDTACDGPDDTTAPPLLTVDGLPVQPVTVDPFPDDLIYYDGGI